jgi:hypothetical protein
MANINAPFGLRPSHYLNGANWSGKARRYYVPSTDSTYAYYIGDLVSPVANGNLLNGCPGVELTHHSGGRGNAWTTGDAASCGVIVGIGSAVATPMGSIAQASDPTNLSIVYAPVTKAHDYYLWVVDDPMVVFEVMVDTIAYTSFNKTAPFYVAAAPTAPVCQSASYAVGSSPQTGSGYPLRFLGAPNRIDNSLASPGTYAVMHCLINNHCYGSAVAGV